MVKLAPALVSVVIVCLVESVAEEGGSSLEMISLHDIDVLVSSLVCLVCPMGTNEVEEVILWFESHVSSVANCSIEVTHYQQLVPLVCSVTYVIQFVIKLLYNIIRHFTVGRIDV